MKISYLATVEAVGAGEFSVDFADVPGCVAAGTTPEEAIRNAEDALAVHLEALVRAGQPVPEPRADVFSSASAPNLVGVLISTSEPHVSERVNVWLPTALLQRIDREVAEQGSGGSRSGFLALAAREKLEGRASMLFGPVLAAAIRDRIAEAATGVGESAVSPPTPVSTKP